MKTPISVAHIHFETQLTISDDFVQLLIIESPSEFYAMVSDLSSLFDGKEGTFVFSTSDKNISPDCLGVFVGDMFTFDLCDKKLINLLYKKLEGLSMGNLVDKYGKLLSELTIFCEELQYHIPFLLAFDEPKPTDIFKAVSLKPETAYDSLVEKLICYINAFIELKRAEFFVFVNLKSVLNDEKLLSLYNHCRNEKVGLLLIESFKHRNLLPEEKAVIITDDLCEILENYQ